MKFSTLLWLMILAAFAAGCNLPNSQATQESQAPTNQLGELPEGTAPAVAASETQATPGEAPIDQGFQPTATFNPKLSSLQVVYVKQGDLWRWSVAGDQQLTVTGNVYQPCLSPDGQLVAFIRPVGDFQVELWAIDINGRDERVLVTVDDLNTIGGGFRDPNALAIAPYEFRWVPGTHLLAFNTQQVLQGPGLFLLDDFHIVNADTMQLNMVLLSGWGGQFQVSPDGKMVALSTPSQIALANLDGSDYRQVLTYAPVTTYSDYRYYARPSWKMDSSGLWAAIPPEDPMAEPIEATSLYEISVSEASARRVNQIPAVSFIESPVAYSPDARYLIYLKDSGDPQAHLRELYISKPDGSGAWMYQKDYLLKFMKWSVDSSNFVFTVGEDQTAWLGNLNAPAKEILPSHNPIAQIQWIDAEHFLFARVDLDLVNLYLGNLENPARLLADQIDPPLIFDFHLGNP